MLVPSAYQARALEIWDELYRTMTNWVSAQIISIAITVFLVWFVLGVLLGMSHSLTVALFAGVATFIPNLGSIIPLIPIAIFTAADDPGKLLIIVPTYLMIQLLESNVLTPYIVKLELDIPAGGLLLFQVVAAAALGALGVLLAIPLLALVITLVREIYSYDVLRLNERGLAFFTDSTGGLRVQVEQNEGIVLLEENGRSAPTTAPPTQPTA
jgi:predicted PurR-regulated permease PerM